MKAMMMAVVAATVAAQAALAPAADAKGLGGVGVGIGVGVGLGLLMHSMNRQPTYAPRHRYVDPREAEMRRRQAIARQRAVEVQKAKAEAAAAARAKAAAEAKAKVAAAGKQNALADATDTIPPQSEVPKGQTADATLSTALVASDVARTTDAAEAPVTPVTAADVTKSREDDTKAPQTNVATTSKSKVSKVADCRKFVPSVGMTITVPCN